MPLSYVAPQYVGVVSAPLTGATAATRFVGGVVSVAPTSGTFQVGDFVISEAGNVFVCTVAGSPGQWVNIKTRNIGSSVFTNPLAESMQRTSANGSNSVLATGRLTLAGISVDAGTVVTSVGFCSGATALSAQTHWWFALCDSAYNVIRQSTDQKGGGSWSSYSPQTLVVDSLPVTAGARSGSSIVTLTFPTLSQSLTSLIAVADSVVVSNANVAAYNGTFSVLSVTATQITYDCTVSATDSLVAPFPTVQLAAGKRTYTVPTNGLVYAVIMAAATVPTLISLGLSASNISSMVPVLCASGDTGLTGTCPSPIAHATGASAYAYAAVL